MVTLLLLSLLAPPGDDPPVRVKLSDEVVAPGERVKVRVKTAADGYLVVLHADAAGRIRVLFPLDPRDSTAVRAGRDYEIRGRGNRDGFTVDQRDGSGLVLAARAGTPFRFDAFVRGGHWDYRALVATDSTDDPEAALFDVLDRMAGGDYDYDLVPYAVSARASNRWRPIWGGHGPGWGYPCRSWRCGAWWSGSRVWIGTSLVFGRPRYVGRRRW
jgi:hypothetical protein